MTYPTPEVRGDGTRGATTHSRSGAAAKRSNPKSKRGGCVGTGGLRGATPCSTSGGAAMRRYPWSKIRSSGCTLLEQP